MNRNWTNSLHITTQLPSIAIQIQAIPNSPRQQNETFSKKRR